jgi:hypothetical protein
MNSKDNPSTSHYMTSDTEMYGHFQRVCKNNLKINAKICVTCPFHGFIVSAVQQYEYRVFGEVRTTKFSKEDFE